MGAVSDDSTRSLGNWLKQRREELGLTLDQAQTETRIRAAYLKALEADDFSALPDPTVGRGFLRNYASYLGLDPLQAVARFSEKVAPPEKVTFPAPADPQNPFRVGAFVPVPLHEMPGFIRRRGWILGIVALVLGVGVFLVLWYWPQITALFSAGSPDQADLVAALTPGPTATLTLSPPPADTTVPSVATATQGPAASATATSRPAWTATARPTATTITPSCPGICLSLTFRDLSWFQVTIDGIRTDSLELRAGDTRSYTATYEIALRIGNASGVSVTVNGMDLGPLGGPTEVVDRVFTLVNGEVTGLTVTPTPGRTGSPVLATPTFTPAPPRVSPTATVSSTRTTSP